MKSLNNNTKTYHHKILINICPWYTLSISNNKHPSKIKDWTPHKVFSNLEVLHYLQHVQNRTLSNHMMLIYWFKTLQKFQSYFNIIDLKNLMNDELLSTLYLKPCKPIVLYCSSNDRLLIGLYVHCVPCFEPHQLIASKE